MAICGALVALNNGKCGIDVPDILAIRDAKHVKKDGIQLRAEQQSSLLVPPERGLNLAGTFIDVIQIARKWRHVVGGICELKDALANNLLSRLLAKLCSPVLFSRHDRQLFDNE